MARLLPAKRNARPYSREPEIEAAFWQACGYGFLSSGYWESVTEIGSRCWPSPESELLRSLKDPPPGATGLFGSPTPSLQHRPRPCNKGGALVALVVGADGAAPGRVQNRTLRPPPPMKTTDPDRLEESHSLHSNRSNLAPGYDSQVDFYSGNDHQL